MKATIEVTNALIDQIKSNASVKAIWKKTIASAYSAMRDGLIDESEYQAEYDAVTYRCAMMVG